MPRADKLSVSVSARTYQRLRDHAERTGLSMAQILAALTDSLELEPEAARK